MSRNDTVSQALCWSRKQLLENGVDDGAYTARLLLSHAMGRSISNLLANGDLPLQKEENVRFAEMVEKRLTGYPTQYILGKWEFMGLPFLVKEGVLIPRADTEILVETVLEKAKKNHIKRILDLGTGTGCIPISLAYYGQMDVVGADINPEAILLAQENAKLNHVPVNWFTGDLFMALPESLQGQFDAVVSNPPYILTDELPLLMHEVRDFEPRLALDGGKDGLDFYRKIVKQCSDWLRSEGWLFFEIGCGQAQAVCGLMEEAFTQIEIIKDLAGLDRVVAGRRKQVKG